MQQSRVVGHDYPARRTRGRFNREGEQQPSESYRTIRRQTLEELRGTERPHASRKVRQSPTLRGGHLDGLDGLRAVAILSVLIFHMDPELLPGGFMGVDVFFVVSGFLITTLLIRERHKTGTNNLPMFWIRRARRLIPALVSLIVIVVPLTWLCAQFVNRAHDLLVRVGPQILGVLTFSYNWVEIAAGSSYFTRNVPQLFTNFWSLAVEEQFYLIWPWVAVLIFTRRLPYTEVSRVLLGVAGTSALLMAFLYSSGATRVYYGTDTHLFGLMIGAALAFEAAKPDGGFLTSFWWRQNGPLAGNISLVALIALMFLIGDGAPSAFHGGIFAANVLTAIIIASFLVGRGGLVKAMNSGPAKFVGERSYAVYLWHWPLLVLAQMVIRTPENSAASWAVRIGAVALTFLVCEASLRWLETPIRKLGFRGAWAALKNKLGAAVVLAVLVVLTAAIAITAPDKTQVEQHIGANEHLINEDGGVSVAPSAPSAPTTPRPQTVNYAVPQGDEITMFGDSLLVTTASQLVKDYPGVDIVARSERTWEEAIPIMQQMEKDNKVRRAVVIALGTNWGIRNPGEVEQEIDSLQHGRTVVLLNTYGAGWEPGVTDELNRIANKYPNVVVGDWNSAAKANAGGLQSDGVHPDYATMPVFSEVIRTSFEELAKTNGN